jgi:hypothetical protein
MKKYQEQQTELKASKNVIRGIQSTAFCQGNEMESERTCDEFEYLPLPTHRTFLCCGFCRGAVYTTVFNVHSA